MERARTTGPDREATVRQVAIVLSSLPASTATHLLDSFAPSQRHMLRRAMASLSDVDPLEQQRALQAFKGQLARPASQSNGPHVKASSVEDEIAVAGREGQGRAQAGSRVVPSSAHTPPSPASDETSSPLGFLGDVEDDTLVGMLSGEHPQTIALVLASIAPVQAARILPSLNPALQGEALSRIGRLGEIPGEVVEEIANHLRSRIEQAETVNKSEAGQRALGAILAAMPKSFAETGKDSPVSNEADAARPLPRSQPSASATPSTSSANNADLPLGPPPADLSAVDQTHRLRLVRDLWPDDEPATSPSHPADENEPSRTAPATSETFESTSAASAAFGSTDAIHQHLLTLSPESLCHALGKVSTRQAILTLCGLPNETANEVLSVLPRGQAKQVRRGMAALQSLELREIDEAKEAVAHASLARSESDNGEPTNAMPQPTRMAA